MKVKKKSQLQEKAVAENLSGKTVVASGAFWSCKGDVRTDKALIECKTTEKTYFSITTKLWEKILSEAINDGLRIPLMVIDLADKERFVIFRPKDFDCRALPTKVVPSVNQLSFRMKLEYETPCLFFLGVKQATYRQHHVLMCLKLSDFIDMFGKELQ